jgi:hypothetical protein
MTLDELVDLVATSREFPVAEPTLINAQVRAYINGLLKQQREACAEAANRVDEGYGSGGAVMETPLIEF